MSGLNDGGKKGRPIEAQSSQFSAPMVLDVVTLSLVLAVMVTVRDDDGSGVLTTLLSARVD